jgi:hypothetical protein
MDNAGLRIVFEVAVVALEIFTVYFYQSGCFRFKARLAGRMLKTVPLLICQCFLIFVLVGGFAANGEDAGEVTAFALAETVGIIFVSIVLFLYFDRTVTAYEYGHRRDMDLLRSESQLRYYETVKSNLDTGCRYKNLVFTINVTYDILTPKER